MWFATSNGLSRYDGYTFKTFHNDPRDSHSISTESFGTLYVDRQGVLWVGTWNGGLNVFDRTTEQFTCYLHDPDDPYSLSHNRVNVIFEDKSGRLWIGTDGGVNSFDPTSGQFFHFGVLWVASVGGGLNKLDPVTGYCQHYRYDPADPHSLSNDSVFAMTEDATGTLWVGTIGGLNRFDRTSEHFTWYTHDPTNPAGLEWGWRLCSASLHATVDGCGLKQKWIKVLHFILRFEHG
jgi:ligand-binding sensor domain-containing protein